MQVWWKVEKKFCTWEGASMAELWQSASSLPLQRLPSSWVSQKLSAAFPTRSWVFGLCNLSGSQQVHLPGYLPQSFLIYCSGFPRKLAVSRTMPWEAQYWAHLNVPQREKMYWGCRFWWLWICNILEFGGFKEFLLGFPPLPLKKKKRGKKNNPEKKSQSLTCVYFSDGTQESN